MFFYGELAEQQIRDSYDKKSFVLLRERGFLQSRLIISIQVLTLVEKEGGFDFTGKNESGIHFKGFYCEKNQSGCIEECEKRECINEYE
jgi:hypothetical protein